MNFTVIGCGAAGNKACIDLIETGYDQSKVVLVNSTKKDIPATYHDQSIIFGASSNRLGGCGKERSIGQEMILADMKSRTIDFDRYVSDDDQAIILVSSTEGGSGSSAVPVLARYFKKVHNKNVIVVALFGFGDDVRGLQNSIGFCKELSEDYTVIALSNARFLEGGNKFAAERQANEAFVNIVKIFTGATIGEGTQQIDNTDLYKVITTPGYAIAGTWDFSRPKTPEEYRNGLVNHLRSQGFIDPGMNPGAKRIAMIFNTPEDSNVDYTAEDMKKTYGTPFEFFTHMAAEGTTGGKYSISYIVSGMRMPSEEIEGILAKYSEEVSKVNRDRDFFFDAIGGVDFAAEAAGFDMLRTKTQTQSAQSFFDSFPGSSKKPDSSDESQSGSSIDY